MVVAAFIINVLIWGSVTKSQKCFKKRRKSTKSNCWGVAGMAAGDTKKRGPRRQPGLMVCRAPKRQVPATQPPGSAGLNKNG